RARQRVEIPRFDLRESRNIRLKALTNRQVPRRRDHRQRTAMKAVRERNDLPSLRLFLSAAQSRHLHRGFVGLSAAVTEEGLALESKPVQSIRQLDLRFGEERISDMPERVGLFVDGGNKLAIAMAEDSSTESGEQIEIAFALDIPDIAPIAAPHDHRLAG